jgi:anti-sigma regulatory factor (Ser/Thr protein kinase)
VEAHVTPVGRWLLGPDAIPILDRASVSVVRDHVRQCAARIELPEVPTASLLNVVSELAHNQLAHAPGRRAFVLVREVQRGDERGLEVVAADEGPGIVDVSAALEGRRTGGASLGVGLAAVLELADEVDFDVRLGEGTCVWARKFARHDVRRRRVGIYGRCYPGETTSGDDAAFVRTQGSLLVGLADGLGHGEGAREASERARDVVLRHPELEPDALLARCDAELAKTRGVVMAAARLTEAPRAVALACVGNIVAMLVGPRSAAGAGRGAGAGRFGGSSSVLGSPGTPRRILLERREMETSDALVLCSDGISSRVDLSGDPALLREHPVVVAQRIVERFARDNDDVLVLVAS